MITNFFICPAGVGTQIVAKSGNVYTPVNNILTNVPAGDITSIINLGCRQVGGPDAGATLGWVAGRFYNVCPGSTPGTVTPAASTIYAVPFRAPGNVPIQTLSANVTAGTTGGKVRFGIYADSNGAPGALVAGSDSGDQVATSGAAATFTPSAPLVLNEGWYWLALEAAATTTLPTLSAFAAGYGADNNALLGQDTLAHAIATTVQEAMGVSATLTYGALPATFPTAAYALVLGAAVPMVVPGT